MKQFINMISVNSIINYYNNTGLIPVNNNSDNNVKSMAKFLVKLRKQNNKDSRLLDNSIPHWSSIKNSKSYNNVVQIIGFYESNNCLPSQIRPVNRKRTIEEDLEYRLACWLNSIKQSLKKSKPVEKFILEMLDKSIKGWRNPNNHEFNAIERANNVLNFWIKNNRIPQQIKKTNNDQDILEYKLATWINSQKQAIKGNNTLNVYPSVLNILEKIPNILN